jgi:hypothetical protein
MRWRGVKLGVGVAFVRRRARDEVSHRLQLRAIQKNSLLQWQN